MTARQFLIEFGVWVRHQPGSTAQWYEGGDYPGDTELRDSFRLFAESGELADDYAAADCASARTAACASLILDNLDDWAAWYETNS